MYQKLQDETLKNGERVELGLLTGPDQSKLAGQVKALLGHKGKIWQWQIEQSLGQQFKDAQSRFYIALRNGQPLANVMTVEAFGIGIFGHVYARPEERRKGLSDRIIGTLVKDFRARAGKALYLGTGFDSPAYHLYARHGFKSVEPKSGCMTWFAQTQEAFEQEAFAQGATRREALSFEHWPTLPALSMMRHPARVRLATMDVLGPVLTEGGALPVLMATSAELDGDRQPISEGPASLGRQPAGGVSPRPPEERAQVAVSRTSDVPVAIACIAPEPIFSKQVDVLDLFCAPGFEGELQPLAEQLQLSAERTAVCYADSFWPAKQQVLRALHFVRASVLPKYFRAQGQAQDVELWIR